MRQASASALSPHLFSHAHTHLTQWIGGEPACWAKVARCGSWSHGFRPAQDNDDLLFAMTSKHALLDWVVNLPHVANMFITLRLLSQLPSKESVLGYLIHVIASHTAPSPSPLQPATHRVVPALHLVHCEVPCGQRKQPARETNALERLLLLHPVAGLLRIQFLGCFG